MESVVTKAVVTVLNIGWALRDHCCPCPREGRRCQLLASHILALPSLAETLLIATTKVKENIFPSLTTNFLRQ